MHLQSSCLLKLSGAAAAAQHVMQPYRHVQRSVVGAGLGLGPAGLAAPRSEAQRAGGALSRRRLPLASLRPFGLGQAEAACVA
jgi:hypothetical protein